MNANSASHNFLDRDVRFWIEQGASICLKASDQHGDPVELTAEEARLLAGKLLDMANQLSALDSNK